MIFKDEFFCGRKKLPWPERVAVDVEGTFRHANSGQIACSLVAFFACVRVAFLAIFVYNEGMKAAQKTIDNQEPEVLDAGTLAAIEKGVKSLDEGKGVSVSSVRPLIRERYQEWLKITQDLRK